jgi:N-acetylated-alpha-linked acidic dipeptidase
LYESAKAVPSPLSESIQVECDWMMIIERAKDNDSKATVFSDWLHETRILHPSSDSPLIENIGTGSDFTVFQHHLGIPSADLVFNGGHKAAVFQYHSKYDSFLWMEKFGDPGFQKHKAMAQLWGLLTWRLASNLVLDFSATSYAMRLKREMQTTDMPGVDLTKLHHAISILCDEAANLDAEAEDLRRRSKSDRQQSLLLKDQIGNINRRYKSMERGFLDPKGLPQRPWYKHVVS